jgi:hypothetical protein
MAISERETSVAGGVGCCRENEYAPPPLFLCPPPRRIDSVYLTINVLPVAKAVLYQMKMAGKSEELTMPTVGFNVELVKLSKFTLSIWVSAAFYTS